MNQALWQSIPADSFIEKFVTNIKKGAIKILVEIGPKEASSEHE